MQGRRRRREPAASTRRGARIAAISSGKRAHPNPAGPLDRARRLTDACARDLADIPRRADQVFSG
jgi:hypothetical protein